MSASRRSYVRLLLFVGTVAGFWESSPYVFGEGGRQIIIIASTIVPAVAFAILFRLYLRGDAQRIDQLLITFYLLGRAVVGLSSGWLGIMVGVAIICIGIYVTERRQLPRWVMVAAVLYIAFFQVGKNTMRARYWYNETDGNKAERILFWVDSSVNRWQEAFNDPSQKEMKKLAYEVLSRTSLLQQSANVLELTPSQVPYQYGHLYSYLPVTLLPRFVWPNKPSVNEANQFYQVNYNLTREDNLSSVSIAVGYMTESYISFGWFGVVGVMFVFGVFYAFYEKCFLSSSSGVFAGSIGMVLLIHILGIESQSAQYLGGLTQQVLLTFLIFSPVLVSGWKSTSAKQLIARPV